MRTLAEIEAAVEQLPPAQQAALYALLGARLEGSAKLGLSPEDFEPWFETAWGAGVPGVPTDEIMAMTRGEE